MQSTLHTIERMFCTTHKVVKIYFKPIERRKGLIMTVKEIKAVLTKANVSFNEAASKEELENIYNEYVAQVQAKENAAQQGLTAKEQENSDIISIIVPYLEQGKDTKAVKTDKTVDIVIPSIVIDRLSFKQYVQCTVLNNMKDSTAIEINALKEKQSNTDKEFTDRDADKLEGKEMLLKCITMQIDKIPAKYYATNSLATLASSIILNKNVEYGVNGCIAATKECFTAIYDNVLLMLKGESVQLTKEQQEKITCLKTSLKNVAMMSCGEVEGVSNSFKMTLSNKHIADLIFSLGNVLQLDKKTGRLKYTSHRGNENSLKVVIQRYLTKLVWARMTGVAVDAI